MGPMLRLFLAAVLGVVVAIAVAFVAMALDPYGETGIMPLAGLVMFVLPALTGALVERKLAERNTSQKVEAQAALEAAVAAEIARRGAS